MGKAKDSYDMRTTISNNKNSRKHGYQKNNLTRN